MKIAVISDSHNVNSAVQAVKPYIKDVDIVLHLGDGADRYKRHYKGI